MADNQFGDRLKELRKQKRWSLGELASRTGLSAPYLSDTERRPGANPTLKTLDRLSKAFGLTIGDLVGAPEVDIVGTAQSVRPVRPVHVSTGKDVRKLRESVEDDENSEIMTLARAVAEVMRDMDRKESKRNQTYYRGRRVRA